MSEEELLRSIKTNPETFSGIMDLYYKAIFGYILRRTGNVDDAADIAAETFLKAFNNIRHFSWRGISIKVWLYRIATNEVNMYFRQQRKFHLLFMRIDPAEGQRLLFNIKNDREELETEMSRHEQFQRVLAALKSLPVRYQEVLALKYFEGKDNREISEILEMNEGTLKSLLSRGVEKLRKLCNQV